MNAPCNHPTVDYTEFRSLETSQVAVPRPERSGFFVSVHQANSACYPVSMSDGVPGNTQYLEPSVSGFELHPAPTALVGFSFRLEEPR